MKNLENILLFEQSPEAMELVRTGEAVIGPGGIRRKGSTGKGFLDMNKPTVMSVADFTALFEGKEHALVVDERLEGLSAKLAYSDKALDEIKRVEWINNALLQRTYALTSEGFRKSLQGIEKVAEELSCLEDYIHKKDNRDILEKVETYTNFLRSDAGKLKSPKLDVTNSQIDRDLDQISALIKVLLYSIERGEETSLQSIQIIISLISPFANVVRTYSCLYYYENEGAIIPGNYNEWISVLKSVASSKAFKDALDYHIGVETAMPFKDKVMASKQLKIYPSLLLRDVKSDMNYVCSHTKEQYLSISDQICNKVINKDYYIQNGNLVIFLDSGDNLIEKNEP